MKITDLLGLLAIFLVVGLIILIAWKGKDLLKLRALQGGFFKQLAFWSTTAANSQKVLFWSESGNLSMIWLPIYTGYMVDFKTMRAWLSMDEFKYEVYLNGEATGESVYLVSERSYIPLDPNNRLSTKAREKLASLEDIAKTAAINAILNASKPAESTDLLRTIANGAYVMMGFFGILAFVIRKWGGV